MYYALWNSNIHIAFNIILSYSVISCVYTNPLFDPDSNPDRRNPDSNPDSRTRARLHVNHSNAKERDRDSLLNYHGVVRACQCSYYFSSSLATFPQPIEKKKQSCTKKEKSALA